MAFYFSKLLFIFLFLLRFGIQNGKTKTLLDGICSPAKYLANAWENSRCVPNLNAIVYTVLEDPGLEPKKRESR